MPHDSNFYPLSAPPSPTFTGELTDHKTLRDEFAMAALTAWLPFFDPFKTDDGSRDALVRKAYFLADSAIYARNK